MRWILAGLVLLLMSCGNRVSETTVDGAVVYAGTFQDADAIHRGSGRASVIQTGAERTLRFEEDFKVTPGPDLYVWLRKPNGEYIEVARLKGSEGSQNYLLPQVNLDEYTQVVVWCKAFSVLFSKAELKKTGS
jgi:hypothetical protein